MADHATQALNRQIGQRLRMARIMRGLSQAKLAEVIGSKGQQIQKYESGGTAISATKMKCFADRLGLPINYFFRLPDYEMPELKFSAQQLPPLLQALQQLNIPTQQVLHLLRALHQLEERHPAQFTLLYRYIVDLAEPNNG